MAVSDVTGISWTDHTFNPWWGCSRVSPACRFCYADAFATRYGHELWRKHGPRRKLSDRNWGRPLVWNRDAAAAGIPAKVFCASMADVFEDHPDVGGERARLWDLIAATPWLRWQLLTKRIENVDRMVPWGDAWPANVWIGTSVENQRFADQRIPLLLALPAAVRFLSCEPLLGPVNLDRYLWLHGASTAGPFYDYTGARRRIPGLRSGIGGQTLTAIPSRDLGWIITGGESGGAKRREMDPTWLSGLALQVMDAGVPLWVKQDSGPRSGLQGRIPDELWIHQFPAELAPAVTRA